MAESGEQLLPQRRLVGIRQRQVDMPTSPGSACQPPPASGSGVATSPVPGPITNAGAPVSAAPLQMMRRCASATGRPPSAMAAKSLISSSSSSCRGTTEIPAPQPPVVVGEHELLALDRPGTGQAGRTDAARRKTERRG